MSRSSSSSTDAAAAGAWAPLGSVSAEVLEHCERERREANGAEDFFGNGSSRIRDGGWSAAVNATCVSRGLRVRSQEAGRVGDVDDNDDALSNGAWPLNAETVRWQQRVVTHNLSQSNPRATLAIVDAFLSSTLATEFVP